MEVTLTVLKVLVIFLAISALYGYLVSPSIVNKAYFDLCKDLGPSNKQMSSIVHTPFSPPFFRCLAAHSVNVYQVYCKKLDLRDNLANDTSILKVLDNYSGYIIREKSTILITFKGTFTYDDAMTDIQVSQSKWPEFHNTNVHSGFLAYFYVIQDAIDSTLNEQENVEKIFITGHSLGAAIATICMLHLLTKKKFTNLSGVVFALPKIGDIDFTQKATTHLRDRLWVVRNIDDAASLYPPGLKLEWKQLDELKTIQFKKDTGHLIDNHSMVLYEKYINEMHMPVDLTSTIVDLS